jgi:Flp pilus assembly protein TadG
MTRRPIRSRGARRQRGAQMVEVALIITPLLLFTFFLLNISMVLFLRSTFQQAVREGARYAITGQLTGGTTCHDTAIKNVVKIKAIGFLNSTSAAATIHVKFRNPTTGAKTTNGAGNIVQVSVENYRYGPLVPFSVFHQNLSISAFAADVMGGLPTVPPICLAE